MLLVCFQGPFRVLISEMYRVLCGKMIALFRSCICQGFGTLAGFCTWVMQRKEPLCIYNKIDPVPRPPAMTEALI